MAENEQDEFDAISDLIAGSRWQQKPKVEPGQDPASLALDYVLGSLPVYNEEQIRAIYEHLLSEIVERNLEEEITGDVSDSSKISLDEEMNELIKMVRRMRQNLSRQAAVNKAVSNREIRETISACVTAIKTLTSHQKAIVTLERNRVLESTLIEVLGELDEGAQAEFQSRFRERLEEVSR